MNGIKLGINTRYLITASALIAQSCQSGSADYEKKCDQVTIGMNVSEVVTIMGEPNDTVYFHSDKFNTELTAFSYPTSALASSNIDIVLSRDTVVYKVCNEP